jgi:hypothetical protein
MSSIPIFSYKQYLDDIIRLRDHGHVAVDAQVARPTSAGSRGLAKSERFMKDPVHMMGESAKAKKITKNAAVKVIVENISYCRETGKLILPEVIQGNLRTWFESRWNDRTTSDKK